ncbi:MAG: PadR family transcriptional regulator [Nanoarchaeota archaeon]
MNDIKITNIVKFCTIILLHKGPKHGYELIKALEANFGKEISASHVYPFLKALEKNKLIEHKKIEARGKKKYFLTKKGKKFTNDLLTRFNDIIDSLVESRVQKCAHCRCEIYKHGFEKTIRGKKLIFCCESCAKHEN